LLDEVDADEFDDNIETRRYGSVRMVGEDSLTRRSVIGMRSF